METLKRNTSENCSAGANMIHFHKRCEKISKPKIEDSCQAFY